MQEPFRNKRSRGYRLRPASGRDRLDSRVRRLCSRLGILAVVVAAAIVIRSLYNIQIIHGAEYRQYAAQQQLLDTTIKATRGEIYDAPASPLPPPAWCGLSGQTPVTAASFIPARPTMTTL